MVENADLVADQPFTELFTGSRGVTLDGMPTVDDV